MSKYSNGYLEHFGVPGMHWGRRKTYSSKYSEEQMRRDKSVYGSGGVNRINKQLLSGNSISGARSKEASRINRSRIAARTASSVGSTVGTIAGALAGWKYSRAITNQLARKYGGMDTATQMIVSGAITAGASKVGQQLGSYGGKSLAMLTGGYSPSKYY